MALPPRSKQVGWKPNATLTPRLARDNPKQMAELFCLLKGFPRDSFESEFVREEVYKVLTEMGRGNRPRRTPKCGHTATRDCMLKGMAPLSVREQAQVSRAAQEQQLEGPGPGIEEDGDGDSSTDGEDIQEAEGAGVDEEAGEVSYVGDLDDIIEPQHLQAIPLPSDQQDRLTQPQQPNGNLERQPHRTATPSSVGSVKGWTEADLLPSRTLRGHIGRVVDASCFCQHAFGEGRSKVASVGVDDTVRLWDVRLAEEEMCWVDPVCGRPAFTCVSACDAFAVTASKPPNIRFWDLKSGEVMRRVNTPSSGTIRALELFPNGAMVAAGAVDKSVYLLSTESGQVLSRLQGHTAAVRALSVPSGMEPSNYVWSASEDCTVRLWDLRTERCVRQLTGGHLGVGGVVGVGHNTKQGVVVSGGVDDAICMWDIGMAKLIDKRDCEHGVSSLSLDSTGERLVSSSCDSRLQLWDIAKGTLLFARDLFGHEESTNRVKFSDTCMHVVSASDDWTLKVWPNGHDPTASSGSGGSEVKVFYRRSPSPFPQLMDLVKQVDAQAEKVNEETNATTVDKHSDGPPEGDPHPQPDAESKPDGEGGEEREEQTEEGQGKEEPVVEGDVTVGKNEREDTVHSDSEGSDEGKQVESSPVHIPTAGTATESDDDDEEEEEEEEAIDLGWDSSVFESEISRQEDLSIELEKKSKEEVIDVIQSITDQVLEMYPWLVRGTNLKKKKKKKSKTKKGEKKPSGEGKGGGGKAVKGKKGNKTAGSNAVGVVGEKLGRNG